MKIFISWSGQRSLSVATILKEWLPFIFGGIELFVSSENIRKGKRWPAEVSKELEASNFGIVCLTDDNLEAPWLLFEAGALSKSVKEASVYTLLLGGLRASDIEGPLSHFQHTVFEKEDFFKLVQSINDTPGQPKQPEVRLRRIFEKFWDELEVAISKAIKTDAKPEKKRSAEEMLNELLETTSYIARNIPELREKQPQSEKRIKASLPLTEGLWKTIVEAVGKVSPFLKAYLLEAVACQLSNGVLTVLFPDDCADHVALVDNSRNAHLMQTVLSDLNISKRCKVVFRVVPRSFSIEVADDRPW